jgi:glycosyltransferase involved in cell wall biosynthesis
MRVGQNPAKFIDHVAQPQKITVAVVSYIPFLGGYYSESLTVLKACLGSLWQNSDQPFDLLVFDNASCPPVRAYLNEMARTGRIQYLVLSDKNVGKGGAWNLIFAAAPGEVVAYADSDIYFNPGWLSASLQILEAFPEAGMVTARPLRTPEKYFNNSLEWARRQPDVTLENGQYVPWEVYRQHVASLGTSDEQARQWFESRSDWRVTRNGVSALISAAHFQFTARKSTLLEFLPFEMDRPMGQVRSLDEMMNERGYLRLAACQPLVGPDDKNAGTLPASCK